MPSPIGRLFRSVIKSSDPIDSGKLFRKLNEAGAFEDPVVADAYNVATWGSKGKLNPDEVLAEMETQTADNRMWNAQQNSFEWLRPENRANLSPDEQARLARAEEMGYDTSKVYMHGTTGDDFSRFKNQPTFFTRSPAVADDYSLSNNRENYDDAEEAIGGYWSGSRTMPVFLKKRAEQERLALPEGGIVDDYLNRGYDAGDDVEYDFNPITYNQAPDSREYVGDLKREGIKTVEIPKDYSPVQGYIAPSRAELDPQEVRSVFARFQDPTSRDIMAGATGAAVIGGGMLQPEDAEAGVKGKLAMDMASRMRRAEEMGYDTSKPWYRGSPQPVDEFTERPAFFTDDPMVANDYAAQYIGQNNEIAPYGPGSNIQKVFLKRRNDNEMVPSSTIMKTAEDMGAIDDKFDPDFSYITYDQNEQAPEIVKNLKDRGYKSARLWDYSMRNGDAAEYLDPSAEDIDKYGPADGTFLNRVELDPRGEVRSVHAAFDPEKAGSGDITAGIVGATGLAALAARPAPARADVGTIQAAKRPMLMDASMGLRNLEKRTGGLLSAPGTADVLEKLAYDDPRSALDYLLAELDWL